MDFGHATKEVVQVAHDVLVGADEKDSEIVHLARNDLMQREGVLDVLQVGEFVDFPVGIAGDIDQRPLVIRLSREAMDRHDREELAERPVIEERLENREVADVLVA